MGFHVIVQTGSDKKGVAALLYPTDDGVPPLELLEGVPLARRFTPDVVLPFDPDDEDGRKLVDLQSNFWGGFPVSPRLRAVLEREPKIEFLPIRIANHRGKIVATDYTLANFLSPVDCVDMKKSICRKRATDPDRVDRIQKLVIDAARVPPDRRAFRLAIRPRIVVVHDEIAAAIRAGKFTGIACIPEAEFDSTGQIGV